MTAKKQTIGIGILAALLCVAGCVAVFGRHQSAQTDVSPAPAGYDSRIQHDKHVKSPSSQASPASGQSGRQASTRDAPARSVARETRLPDNTHFVADGVTYPIHRYRALAVANDPGATQWWTTDTNLDTAWQKSDGSGTVIAIIDTGFALNHEEFTGRWDINSGESGPTTQEDPALSTCSGTLDKSCNGIDDDGNGYVDDHLGWDFVSDDNSVMAGETDPTNSSAFHGTAVAGIAAATGNNSLGIAGVSWGTKILPVQALGDNGGGDTLTVSRAIRYAADRGADVINLSLGSTSSDSYLRSAVQYALSKGTVVVAASGNDGCKCISYPANYPETVAVGSYDSAGTPSSFSSYGANLDLLAPGADMTSAAWLPTDGTSGYYSGLYGTSFASPFVSGLLANARAAQPDATWGELVGVLRETLDHRTMTATQPRNDQYGFGFTQAGTFISRLVDGLSATTRYIFDVSSSDTLGSTNSYDCQGDYPGITLYKVVRGGVPNYTVSDLAQAQDAATGASVSNRGYVCVGLPTDIIDTKRDINPRAEFSNYYSKPG